MSSSQGFFAEILTPGSSLNPVFLHILDGAFAALLLVFVALAVITSGNIHIFMLMLIELGLWASVKWFVHELKNTQEQTTGNDKGTKDQ